MQFSAIHRQKVRVTSFEIKLDAQNNKASCTKHEMCTLPQGVSQRLITVKEFTCMITPNSLLLKEVSTRNQLKINLRIILLG